MDNYGQGVAAVVIRDGKVLVLISKQPSQIAGWLMNQTIYQIAMRISLIHYTNSTIKNGEKIMEQF
jgi:hypothetical protein